MTVWLITGKIIKTTVPEMTYTVSGGTLNPTHSLTHSLCTSNVSYHRFYPSGLACLCVILCTLLLMSIKNVCVFCLRVSICLCLSFCF